MYIHITLAYDFVDSMSVTEVKISVSVVAMFRENSPFKVAVALISIWTQKQTTGNNGLKIHLCAPSTNRI